MIPRAGGPVGAAVDRAPPPAAALPSPRRGSACRWRRPGAVVRGTGSAKLDCERSATSAASWPTAGLHNGTALNARAGALGKFNCARGATQNWTVEKQLQGVGD